LSYARAQEVNKQTVDLAAKRAAEVCKGDYKKIEPDKSIIDNTVVTDMGRIAPRRMQPRGTEIWIECVL